MPVTADSPALPRTMPLADWRETKDTLHLFAQIVGKIKLAVVPPANHWWHVALHPDARGLTTGPMHWQGVDFEIRFDLCDSDLVVVAAGSERRIDLTRQLSVAQFHARVFEVLDGLGVRGLSINPKPFGVPMTTPFPDDHEHASWDSDAVLRAWHMLEWTHGQLQTFAGWFTGKASPLHVFWHSFDLAHTRFSGRPGAPPADADAVTQEAYSRECASFGFWFGDDQTPEPTFYSYIAPEPATLADAPLVPQSARWVDTGNGHLATITWREVFAQPDPGATLLDFLQSAYEAEATTAGWPMASLASTWAPVPLHLQHPSGNGARA